MVPLKEREAAVLAFIHRYHAEYKNSPLVSEIADQCRCTVSTARNVLGRLQAKGYIDWINVGRRRLILPLWKA